jgi:hypothetical protein
MERLYKGSRYRIFNFWRCLLLMMNLLCICIYLLSHEDTQILFFLGFLYINIQTNHNLKNININSHQILLI